MFLRCFFMVIAEVLLYLQKMRFEVSIERCCMCLLFVLFGSVSAMSQSVLPLPSSMTVGKGTFTISDETVIHTNMQDKAARRTVASLRRCVGKDLTVMRERSTKNFILIESRSELREEGCHTLHVDGSGIRIQAGSASGFFYAFQTLNQLLDDGKVPFVDIEDAPRFAYRGMMLDCSRHFWDVDFIKKQIDAMARFKLNRLHLHLTDAAGWRMETEKYPLLTEKTAWRTQSDWTRWWIEKDRRYCGKDATGAYGGYYTQDELRDLVRYAMDRHVTIIPEIEMPGHSEEVLFAYPELKCVNAGQDCGDLCVGNEQTFEFLENVLLEVMRIFPSKYIHIGGDESGRQAWMKCPRCQARMKAEGLETAAQLQAYLTARIEKFLNRHGRELLGWDEILEGELAPNATVMSWRGTEGGLAAARMGHRVVMSPGGYCYLDGYQDAPESQPKAFGGFLPLEKVFGYDPIPQEMKGTEQEKYIIGIQGNLWTEMIETPEHVEYMLYPRMLAIAERGWSPQSDDYADFRRRALKAVGWLQQNGYHPFDLKNETGARAESRTEIRHKGRGKKVQYLAPYSDAYRAGGDGSLTDGKRGGWSYGDGRWQGFISSERLDVVIDMGRKQTIRSVAADFMQFTGPEIFEPAEVRVSFSDDGTTWKVGDLEVREVSRDKDYFIRHFRWEGINRARYVRLQASEGKFGGWIFTDEIVIN